MLCTTKNLPGRILATAMDFPAAPGNARKHLMRLDTGEYALVASWMTHSSLWGRTRVYQIVLRVGRNHDLAIKQFDEWVGLPQSVPPGMPES